MCIVRAVLSLLRSFVHLLWIWRERRNVRVIAHTICYSTISVLTCINIVYITLLQIMCAMSAHFLSVALSMSLSPLFFFAFKLSNLYAFSVLCFFCQFQFFILINRWFVVFYSLRVFFFALILCIGPILLNHVVYRLFYLCKQRWIWRFFFLLLNSLSLSQDRISISIHVGIRIWNTIRRQMRTERCENWQEHWAKTHTHR